MILFIVKNWNDYLLYHNILVQLPILSIVVEEAIKITESYNNNHHHWKEEQKNKRRRQSPILAKQLLKRLKIFVPQLPVQWDVQSVVMIRLYAYVYEHCYRHNSFSLGGGGGDDERLRKKINTNTTKHTFLHILKFDST